MPYDAPMGLEEALMDEEARRRALAYLGAPEAPLVPVPDGMGTRNAPSAPASAGMEEVPEPAGTTGTDLVQRYLAAQGADARQARLNSLGEGFGNAASTILGAAGVPYTRSRSEAPRAAQSVLELERVKTAGERPSGGRAAKPPGMTDAQAQAAVRASYPEAPEELVINTTASSFDNVMKDLRAKYGAGKREELAARQIGATDERARLKREQDGKKWAEERDIKWADMSLDERALAEKIAAREQAAKAKATARIEDQSKEFGVKYTESGLPEFKDQYAKAQEIFNKYPKSLPGVGIAEGRVPRRFTSSDGKLLRTVAGQMLLAYKKSVTGLGSSAKEDAAIRNATGLIETGDDESIQMGVSVLKDVMDAKEKALQAGYKQEAVDAVIDRLSQRPRTPSTTSKTTPPPGKPQPRRKRDKEGRLWEEQPDGSARVGR